MRVVEAPNHAHIGSKDVSVFLAGGITGCPDWQTDFINACKGHLEQNAVLLNPRRANFDVSDPDATTYQIEWEFDYLEKSDITIFWFPKESICPITLFELGKQWSILDKKVIVGCDLQYPRRNDILHQGRLMNQKIHTGFEAFSKYAVQEIEAVCCQKLGIGYF